MQPCVTTCSKSTKRRGLSWTGTSNQTFVFWQKQPEGSYRPTPISLFNGRHYISPLTSTSQRHARQPLGWFSNSRSKIGESVGSSNSSLRCHPSHPKSFQQQGDLSFLWRPECQLVHFDHLFVQQSSLLYISAEQPFWADHEGHAQVQQPENGEVVQSGREVVPQLWCDECLHVLCDVAHRLSHSVCWSAAASRNLPPICYKCHISHY